MSFNIDLILSISSPSTVSERLKEKTKGPIHARLALMRGGLRTGAGKRGVCFHMVVNILKRHSHSISVYGLCNCVTLYIKSTILHVQKAA